MESTQVRAPKFKRQPQHIGGLKLQERDVKIVKLVHDYRFIDSDQIRALIEGSEQGILRRLKKLFHHSFLDRPLSQFVYPLSGTPKMVYALGNRGADLLAESFGIDRGKIRWNEKNKGVRDRHIRHTLMISDFRICLDKALGTLPDTSLLFWQKENRKELKDYAHVRSSHGRQRKIAIIPDAFFGVEDVKPKPVKYFFLEADQGTMTNARFLNKMKAYWTWNKKEKGHTRKFGIEAFRVLTITRTEQRKENLRNTSIKADDRETGSLMFWFASEENYNIQKPDTILGSIWQTPNDNTWYSILE